MLLYTEPAGHPHSFRLSGEKYYPLNKPSFMAAVEQSEPEAVPASTSVLTVLPPPSDSLTDLSVEEPSGTTTTSKKRPASPASQASPGRLVSVSPQLRKIASAGLDKAQRALSPKLNKRPRLSPQPMTAAAAMVDEAEAQQAEKNKDKPSSPQTSPNPAKQALGALMGMSGVASNKNVNASAAPMSDAIKTVAQSLHIPGSDTAGETHAQTSPVSLSSFGTLGSSTAATALPIGSTVESPGSMEDAVHEAAVEMRENAGDVSPEDGNKAFSYPGPHLPAHLSEPRRGMSLPQSSSRPAGSRSPSAKKHKCPYCATEFTRHHNLKSHLLTHSQEKPYVCQTCQSRFRRLHDLKRHTKLHTGERPHVCPKCGRRFARGDALARHNKGPGGCAGRRASVGSYGGDDDYGDGNEDSTMDGIVYTEPGQIDDDDTEPRPGMPSIRKHEAPNEPSSHQSGLPPFHSRSPNTYPPIQGRPPGGLVGGLFPPTANHAGSNSSSTSPVSTSGTLPFPPTPTGPTQHAPVQPGAPGFTSNPITESPKPLSPGSGGHESSIYRNRSPSMTNQYQQQQTSPYGRGSGPPPNMGSLPPPAGLAPQLPPPHQLNPDSRFSIHNQGPAHPPTGPTGPPTHMTGGGLSSQSNSLSSHGQSHHGSGDGVSTLYPQGPSRDDRLWSIVKALEERVNGLQDEVSSLKTQLALATQPKAR